MADSEEIKKLNDELDKLEFSLKSIADSLSERLNNSLVTSNTQAQKLVDSFEKGENITSKIYNELIKNQEKSNKLALNKIKLETDLSKAQSNNNFKAEKSIRIALYQNQLTSNQLDKTNDLLYKIEQINKQKTTQNSLSNAIKSTTEKTLGTYISSIKEMFTLTGLFTFLINAAFKADAQVTELSKSLGISKDQAYDLRQNIVDFSAASNDAFINVSRLTKAQAELSQQLGISVKFSNEELANFAKLTELTGLTAEEAGKLTSFAAATGKSTKDYASSIRVGAFYAQQATKTHFSTKQILQDVSKLSAGILIKFQGNPEAIAKSVVQAKALGITLEQIDKTGESLLNFESSIENELKAELLTGRQLNLERARAAALTGDQATLMQEVAKQTGSLADFQNMNVIAQKSLAEAFGMSREEMAEMLIKQQAINKYGSEAAQLNTQQLEDMERQKLSLSEYLEKQEQQQTAQDKFNNTIIKLQDLVGNLVAGPFGQLLDVISNILNNAALIKVVIGTLVGMSMTRLITSLAAMVIPLITGAAASVTMMSALTLGVGALAIAGSIAAISSSMNKSKEEMSQPKFARGGIVTSEINNATIGEAGPEAIIPLNSLRANNILGNINNTPSIDLTPMVTIMSEVKSAIDKLYSKNTTISMDGKAVGTTLTQGSYKFA